MAEKEKKKKIKKKDRKKEQAEKTPPEDRYTACKIKNTDLLCLFVLHTVMTATL